MMHDEALLTKLNADHKAVLLMAAQHIEKHGHAKHQLRTRGGATCAYGAILFVSGTCPCGCGGFSPAAWAAIMKLSQYVDGDIVKWNDHALQTGANVVKTLRDCAKDKPRSVA